MPVAFVTGGTGFLGINLIEQLLAKKWEVVALHRPTSSMKDLRKKDIQLVEGSITAPDSLGAALPENVDAVFHVAGNTSMWSRRNKIQTRDNVEGTRNMVDAALERRARRFIHTSSIAFYGHHEQHIDEETRSNAIDSPMNYNRTKYLAEIEVRRGIDRGLDAVIINPADIIGPYDYRGWSQLFILIDRQKLPGVAPAIHTFCHAREVALAHIAAFHKGRTGENYLLGGVEIDFASLAREIGSLLGKPTPKRPTPAWILKLIGRLSLWASYITGKEPDITPEKVFLVTHNMLCNSKKAERELDYHPASLESMLDDCYRWMLGEGMIGQKK